MHNIMYGCGAELLAVKRDEYTGKPLWLYENAIHTAVNSAKRHFEILLKACVKMVHFAKEDHVVARLTRRAANTLSHLRRHQMLKVATLRSWIRSALTG